MTASLATSRPRRPITRRLLAVAAGALLADLATKAVGVALLEHSSVGPGWARLLVVRNSGFAFGIGARWSDGAVLAVTVIVLAALVTAVWQGAPIGPAPAGLILGGALANVLDRAVDGSVVDLIDIGQWPTFNLADTFIVIGLALIMVRGGSSAGNASAMDDGSG